MDLSPEHAPEVLLAIVVGVLPLCFIIVLYGRTKAFCTVRTARLFDFCG